MIRAPTARPESAPMPAITYFLRTGSALRVDSDEDFERLRDRVEGLLDCNESIVVERVEVERDSGRRTRVAIVVPASAIATVRIEEPAPLSEELDSVALHAQVS